MYSLTILEDHMMTAHNVKSPTRFPTPTNKHANSEEQMPKVSTIGNVDDCNQPNNNKYIEEHFLK